MRNRNWKAFTASFVSLAAAIALVHTAKIGSALACAGGDFSDADRMSVFSPEVIGDESCSPLFRTNRLFYIDHRDNAELTRDALEKANATEWSQWLAGSLKPEQVNTLVYKLSLADVQNLAIAIGSGGAKEVPLSNDARFIFFALLGSHDRDLLAKGLSYLAYARRVQPLATRAIELNEWGSPVRGGQRPLEPADAAALIAEGVAGIASTANRSLQARYAFQVLRLHYYAKGYAAASDYFENNRGVLGAVKSIKYRALDLAAGARYKQKQYGIANYYWSLAFDQYEPLRKSAYYSFHPQEQNDWQQTLSLARSPREKTVLWQIFGVYADGVEGIRQIYAIDPKSDLLPLLLVRQVNIAEEAINFLPETDGLVRPGSVISPSDLQTLKGIADAGNALKPEVWSLGVGHIYALLGESKMASVYLEKAAGAVRGPSIVADQIRMSKFYNFVNASQKADTAAEPYLAAEINWLRDDKREFPETRRETLLPWALAKLSSLYFANGDWVRGLLLADQAQSPVYLDNGKLDAILKFKAAPSPSFFDTVLLKIYPHTVADLNEIKAINSTFAGDYDAAIAAFARAGKTQSLRADPFTNRIVDCHDCDFEIPHVTYSKASFVAKLKQEAQVANSNGPGAARASMHVANALYNISYYGNARAFSETELSSFDRQGPRALSMNAAKAAYVKAAASVTDAETRATATFMAAKCEQNEYYARKGADDPAVQPGKRAFFDKLSSEFSETAFYREALAECGYLKAYVKAAIK